MSSKKPNLTTALATAVMQRGLGAVTTAATTAVAGRLPTAAALRVWQAWKDAADRSPEFEQLTAETPSCGPLAGRLREARGRSSYHFFRLGASLWSLRLLDVTTANGVQVELAEWAARGKPPMSTLKVTINADGTVPKRLPTEIRWLLEQT